MGRGGSSGRSSGGGGRSRSGSSRSFSGRSRSGSAGRGGRSASGGQAGGAPPRQPSFGPGRGPASPPPRAPRPPRPPRRPGRMWYFRRPAPPPGGYGYAPRRRSGCASVISVLIVLAIIFIAFNVVSFRRPREPVPTGVVNQEPAAAKTIRREPLAAGECEEIDKWYDDQLGWITSESKMTAGLKTFYKKTGVQPYVVIAGEVDGKGENFTDAEAEAYLQTVYDSLFEDEGHLIFLFLEYESGSYHEYLYVGSQAAKVIDQEVQEVIYDYADYYYTSDLDDNEFFSTIFEKAAEAIVIVHE